mmetsp:Transcript_75626/g.177552  ORF Transcript_75626/g.177552 Transcript_75626/m.177552 type:complete len:83 (+) Transcript_75626:543-791(+)
MFIEDPKVVIDLARVTKPGGLVILANRKDRWDALGHGDQAKALETEGVWTSVSSKVECVCPKSEEYVSNPDLHYHWEAFTKK